MKSYESFEETIEFNSLVNFIKVYNAEDTSQALCLVGHTGISKSAMVDEAINKLNEEQSSKWGYRLVEIKAGFIDKSDLVGYSTIIENSVLGKIFEDAPMEALMLSSDKFIQACRDFLDQYKGPEDELIKQVRYFARTPIMFFDEINRAPESVLNQMMVIINSHKFSEDLDMKIAVKVAACNMPIDQEGRFKDDEFIKYITTVLNDTAVLDRFKFIPVTESDDINEAAALHFKAKYPSQAQRIDACKQFFYRPDLIETDVHSNVVGKFPTLRGWDYLFHYLDQLGDQRHCSDVVEGLVGKASKASGLNISKRGRRGEVEMIHDCLKYNIPLLLLGRMGIAKTARINQISKQLDYKVLYINLGSVDRTTIRGYPVREDFTKRVFGIDAPSKKGVDEFMSKRDFLRNTTSYIPKADVAKAVQEARKTGKKVVFLFDEINRASAIVQSSVYDVISLGKYMGVDLKGMEYTVAAAGNIDYSGGTSFMTEDIDTATLHRFASFFKNEITESDINAVLTYIESKGMRQAASVIRSADPKLFLEEVNNLDISENLLDSLFSFRTFEKIQKVYEGCPKPIPSMKQMTEDRKVLFEQNVLAAIGFLKVPFAGDRVALNSIPMEEVSNLKMNEYQDIINRVNDFADQYIKREVLSAVPPGLTAHVRRGIHKLIQPIEKAKHNLYEKPVEAVHEIISNNEPEHQKHVLMQRLEEDLLEDVTDEQRKKTEKAILNWIRSVNAQELHLFWRKLKQDKGFNWNLKRMHVIDLPSTKKESNIQSGSETFFESVTVEYTEVALSASRVRLAPLNLKANIFSIVVPSSHRNTAFHVKVSCKEDVKVKMDFDVDKGREALSVNLSFLGDESEVVVNYKINWPDLYEIVAVNHAYHRFAKNETYDPLEVLKPSSSLVYENEKNLAAVDRAISTFQNPQNQVSMLHQLDMNAILTNLLFS